MPPNDENKTKDIYTGYIASVVMALIASGWIAVWLLLPFSGFLSDSLLLLWRGILASGFFFAISIGDPIGTVMDKSSWRHMLKRFGGGFLFGVAAYLLILAPLAGAGMSTFLQLILVVLYLPARALIQKFTNVIGDHAAGSTDGLATALLSFARWPDRFLFVMFMSVSFAVFWTYTATLQVTLVMLMVWLTLITAVIATRAYSEDELSPKEADFQAWLALDDADSKAEQPISRAVEELGKIIRVVVPGAVLFGGMTCFAVQALLAWTPEIANSLTETDELARSVGIIAASVLGIVFGTMIMGLVFGLVLLQITAKMLNWSVYHHRENCFHLLRAMRFRPLQRAS
ncbi:MAG: hypothetical protein KUG69_08270 [Marinosulfonomonas sp.]|nr:hypothetical protein [Marinosulfonomonas sp.]